MVSYRLVWQLQLECTRGWIMSPMSLVTSHDPPGGVWMTEQPDGCPLVLSLLGSVPFRAGDCDLSQIPEQVPWMWKSKQRKNNKYITITVIADHDFCYTMFQRHVSPDSYVVFFRQPHWTWNTKNSEPPTSCLYMFLHLFEGQLASVAISVATHAESDWDLQSQAFKARLWDRGLITITVIADLALFNFVPVCHGPTVIMIGSADIWISILIFRLVTS